MLFLALTAILALVSLPTPSASQGDNITLPLTPPCQSNQHQPASLTMRCKKQQEMRLPSTFETRYVTPFYQPYFGGRNPKICIYTLNNIPAPTLTNLSTPVYSCRLANV